MIFIINYLTHIYIIQKYKYMNHWIPIAVKIKNTAIPINIRQIKDPKYVLNIDYKLLI